MSAIIQGKSKFAATRPCLYFGGDRGLGEKRRKRCERRSGRPAGGAYLDHFTIEEHLRVQTAIGLRAYELWQGAGIRQNDPLSDWLRAEGEVLKEFCRARESEVLR